MMHGISELQLSLLVIGVLSVLGVWAYNHWQERRHRKHADAIFQQQSRQDVLVSGALPVDPHIAASPQLESIEPTAEPCIIEHERVRIEPVFIDPEVTSSPTADPSLQHLSSSMDQPHVETLDAVEPTDIRADTRITRIESAPGLDSGVTAHQQHEQHEQHEQHPQQEQQEQHDGAPPADESVDISDVPILDTVVDREPPLTLADPVIDAIVHLNAPELISAPLFWVKQRQILSRLANRIVWSGLDENTAQWQSLHANDANSYRRLVGALLLVNRNGPIAADDLALYCDGVRQLAAHYQAQTIVPVVADILTRARSLDAYCASVDCRLSLNLMHHEGQGISLDALAQLTEMTGLRRHDLRYQIDQGMLYAFDVKNRPAFTMSLLGGSPREDQGASLTHVAGLTLTLDVPKVPEGVAVFDRMMQLAHHLAQHLDAVIVDDARVPLSDAMLSKIRARIDELHQSMLQHEIPPGDRRALRLYA